jgi:tryptophan-rich sensory protein
LFTLETRLFLPRPLEIVFPFFADAGNLETITPPWLRFEMVTPRPIAMRAGALGLFALQLALNALWSPLFFGLRNPLAGLADIVPLWAAILATLVCFWRISPLAGVLLVPYWLWVSFATALNFMIWKMNR